MSGQTVFPEDLEMSLIRCRVLAVVVLDRVEDAVPLAAALLRGGVRGMELTLRTPAALDGVRAIRAALPDMMVGVGTILTPEQLVQAQEAGADFGVSPGMNPRVVDAAIQQGFPFAPGVATPSEIEAAMEKGCRLLKFFPCGALGGLNVLKILVAPYEHLGLRFIPLGGIDGENMQDYLAHDFIAAAGGSWLAPKKLIEAGNWGEIEARARAASGPRSGNGSE